MTTIKEAQDRAREAHLKWLSKAKTAVINGSELTVLPYGYLSQAVAEAVEQTIKEERERFANDFPDFAHEHYKGCTSEDNGGYTYGYDTEVLYIVEQYFKALNQDK